MNKPLIISRNQIKTLLPAIDLIPLIERAFIEYSSGNAVIPPVGEMLFKSPPGEAHIKYGYIKNESLFTVKIATGFYENQKLGLSSSQGVILLFSQITGALEAILLDEGLLTDVRTTIASMISLKYLAPSTIHHIGILGTGIQAGLQLDYLSKVTDCKSIIVWGRNSNNCTAFAKHHKSKGYHITIADSIDHLMDQCNVVITATPATTPLINFEQVKRGTHITAIGSDTAEKIELDPLILKNSDVVVSDSLAQSNSRGEVFRARGTGNINEDHLIELGNLIQNPALGRKNNDQITVADLTGVAVQDIMIATAIYNEYKTQNS